MSGTSADGIDAVLVQFDSDRCHLVGSSSQPFSASLQRQIHALADGQSCTLEQLAELDLTLGHAFAEAALALVSQHQIAPEQIAAIGCHGQTVRHRPTTDATQGFSIQIGDANIIAERTGITTVADFRRRDIAAGGHGAPLAPGFHAWAFGSATESRAVINIGGMSNITWLPADGTATGYDLGPGNVLMDAWCIKHLQQAYDSDGQWAAGGDLEPALLGKLIAHPFIQATPPKSTGRETFNLHWLQSLLQNETPQNVQRTLCEFTAQVIARTCAPLAGNAAYICGGGAQNRFLMQRLAALLPQWRIESTETIGVHPQWVEAMAFAWLARQRVTHQPGNLCSVTGASHPVVLGAIFPAR